MTAAGTLRFGASAHLEDAWKTEANSLHSETIKRVLNLPADTIITFKSHDDSISQRVTVDQNREKTRRMTLASDEGREGKEKSGTS